MFKGDFVITNNINALPVYSANYKLVMMTENGSLVQQYKGISIPGTILLPPYGAVCAEADNNLEAYYAIYFNHLGEYESNSFIAAILSALHQGINVCMYLPYDAKELRYNVALVEYFANTFGILIGTDAPVMYVYDQNPNLYLNILTTLYTNNRIDVEELFVLYPQGMPISEILLPKLIQEFNAPLMKDINQYTNYFFNYKEKIKANNNIFLQPGIVFGD